MEPKDVEVVKVVLLSFGIFVGVGVLCAGAVALRAFSRWLTERFRPDMSRRYGRVPDYIERQLQEIADEEESPPLPSRRTGEPNDFEQRFQQQLSELRAGIFDNEERRGLRELGDRVRGLSVRVDELSTAAQLRATDAISFGARLDRFDGTLGSVLARLEELEGQAKVAPAPERASATDSDVLYAEFSLVSGGRATRCDGRGRNPQLGGGRAVLACDRVRGHAGQCHCHTNGGPFALTSLEPLHDGLAQCNPVDVESEIEHVSRIGFPRCGVRDYANRNRTCGRAFGHQNGHCHQGNDGRLAWWGWSDSLKNNCRAPAYVHTEEGVVTEECRLTAGHICAHVAHGACGVLGIGSLTCRLPRGHDGDHEQGAAASLE